MAVDTRGAGRGESDAPSRARRLLRLENFYRLGVVIKGIDGALEVIGAFILMFAPQVVHHVLSPLEQPIYGDHPIRILAWHWAFNMDREFAAGAPVLIVVFLIVHGSIKVALSYCLLREFTWVYPWALAAMALFIAYESVLLIRGPSVGLALFTALDLIITVLIWREWRALKRSTA